MGGRGSDGGAPWGSSRSRGPCPASRAVLGVVSRLKGDTGARVSLQEGKQSSCAGGGEAAEPAPGVLCFMGKLSSLQE